MSTSPKKIISSLQGAASKLTVGTHRAWALVELSRTEEERSASTFATIRMVWALVELSRLDNYHGERSHHDLSLVFCSEDFFFSSLEG